VNLVLKKIYSAQEQGGNLASSIDVNIIDVPCPSVGDFQRWTLELEQLGGASDARPVAQYRAKKEHLVQLWHT
jgi:hypothetical protein